jgi:hypothetical protein
MDARKWTPNGQSIAQATAYSRMLSPHCGCVVVLLHAEEHLVCLEVAGALTTTLKRHSGQVSILYLCCTLVARAEITSCACAQKKNTFWVALYNGVCLIFMWLLLSYQ